MDIQIIDKLLTISKDPKELTLKLKRVEGFWQAHLRTVGENGLNSVDELLRNYIYIYVNCKKLKFGLDFLKQNDLNATNY